MATERSDVKKLKEQVAQDLAPATIVERVGERIGASVSTSAVFGDPVKRGDVTVIPVARAAWGFGGGGGVNVKDADDGPETGSGGGGGGGGAAAPVGYIEITPAGATYHRIDDPVRRAGAAALTALATAAVLIARSRRG